MVRIHVARRAAARAENCSDAAMNRRMRARLDFFAHRGVPYIAGISQGDVVTGGVVNGNTCTRCGRAHELARGTTIDIRQDCSALHTGAQIHMMPYVYHFGATATTRPPLPSPSAITSSAAANRRCAHDAPRRESLQTCAGAAQGAAQVAICPIALPSWQSRHRGFCIFVPITRSLIVQHRCCKHCIVGT